MLTKLFSLLMCVYCILMFTGCQNSTGNTNVSNHETTIPAEQSTADQTEEFTGYQAGEVQSEFIYFNDALYVLESANEQTLPAGFVQTGNIETEDSFSIPAQNGQSAHVPVGTAVYADADDTRYLYISSPRSGFEMFIRADLVTNWWAAD